MRADVANGQGRPAMAVMRKIPYAALPCKGGTDGNLRQRIRRFGPSPI